MTNQLETIYSNKLKSRQEETRFTDSAFMYDKEEFTTFVKSFYNDQVHNEETGLIQLGKNLVAEVVKKPNLVLAFIFFSRQQEPGTFVNSYTQFSRNIIRLTDVSISKNALPYLDDAVAIDALNKL
jgi:hypothetical protein